MVKIILKASSTTTVRIYTSSWL